MFPADLESLLTRVECHNLPAARARLQELAADQAELLALVRLADDLGDALAAAADPDAALRNLSRYVHARGSRLQFYHLLSDDPATLDRLIRVLGASRYLADVLVRNPEYIEVLSDSTLLETSRSRTQMTEELRRTCDAFPTSLTGLDVVRRFRRRELLRIGAADLCGMTDLRQTTEQLSSLADAVVDQCLRIVASGDDSHRLVVLALGKLGGDELNYSSDIDLVFVTPTSGRLDAAARLARALTHALSDATGEGFLYRVDLRLRPYGGGGALVVSAETLGEYLTTNAHPAERQAMLKARAIAGDVAGGETFLQSLQPALFRDAVAARHQVRELKARIERQLMARDEAVSHLKLGPGGIRDIEFLIQALQLEFGAAELEIVAGNTLLALERLVAHGLLSTEDGHALREAYVFLRLVEHRLQLMDNQQVHRLPAQPDERRVLARTLGIEGLESAQVLNDTYRGHAHKVRDIFERVLSETAAGPRDAVAGNSGLRGVPFVQSTHTEILDRVREPADVAILAQRESHQRWKVTIALWDHIGILSILTGLFAAHRIDILSGDVASLRGPGKRRARKALDTFVVVAPRWVDEAFWRELRDELAELAARLAAGDMESAREQIVDRVSAAAQAADHPQSPLFPIHVEVDNDASPDTTKLRIRSINTLGFLFEFSGALALLGANIQRVHIRTIHHEVDDTFWVTDARGRKLVDADRVVELRVAAALIKQFMHLLPRSPQPAQALRQFSALARQILSRPDWVTDIQSLKSDAVLRTLAELMGVSQFLWEDFLREQHQNLFPVIRNIPALDATKTKDELRNELSTVVGGSADPAQAIEKLNQFKDREMFRVDLRHITGRIELDQFSRELTDLAEIVIDEACRLCHAALHQRFGSPLLEGGRPCTWSVCGLGKFGGRELGYASDIELLFMYEGEGQTNGPNPIANSRYFEEFVALFLQTLRARREGIFEIDLRLRPHGKAGALACSLESFCQYFSVGGDARQFERLALVKLRPVVGDASLAGRIVKARDRFVYSGQPLDYENILHLRQRQAAELVSPRELSAKHSLGGLVDLEYFVQAKQIEIGHTNKSVHVTGTLDAIDQLHQAGVFPAERARELSDAYRFLRRLIEALRVVRGHAQDLTIPTAGTRDFAHLARRMHYESVPELAQDIDQRMALAQNLWNDVSKPT